MKLADLIRALQAVLADAGEHVGDEEAGNLPVEFNDGAGGTHSITDVRLTKVHPAHGDPSAYVWMEN